MRLALMGEAGDLPHPSRTGILLCGHAHWDTPLATLAHGVQVLNVDARAVLLQRGGNAP